MNHIPEGVTVLICSFNGAKNLPATLACLAAQQVGTSLDWEVLVVNNASSDNTREVALGAQSIVPVSVRVLDEPVKGKDQALYTGIRQACYSYVLVCDDDNWLAADYVRVAFDIMNGHPRIGMLGGRGVPVFEKSPPSWFFQFESYYATGRQGRHRGELRATVDFGGYLWGAGSVIRKEAFLRLEEAGFERLLTYTQYPEYRCEDLELCLAIKMAGYKLWYDDRLVFQHYIPAQRLDWSYLLNNFKAGGMGAALLQPYREIVYAEDKGQGMPRRWLPALLVRLGGVTRYLSQPRSYPFFFAVLFRKGRFEGSIPFQEVVVNSYCLYALWRVRASHKALCGRLVQLSKALAKMEHRTESVL